MGPGGLVQGKNRVMREFKSGMNCATVHELIINVHEMFMNRPQFLVNIILFIKSEPDPL